MRYEIVLPEYSIYPTDERSAVRACQELGAPFFFEFDDSWKMLWVCHLRGGMIVRERLEDQQCMCGGCHGDHGHNGDSPFLH